MPWKSRWEGELKKFGNPGGRGGSNNVAIWGGVDFFLE